VRANSLLHKLELQAPKDVVPSRDDGAGAELQQHGLQLGLVNRV